MSVYKVYQDVIEDVISGVRDLFTEDGVDEQVLQELRQTWESKLLATKAVSQEQKKPEYIAGGFVNNKPQPTTTATATTTAIKQQQSQQLQQQQTQQQSQQSQQHQQVGHNQVPTPVTQVITAAETKMVPIQITLPVQATAGTAEGGGIALPRVLNIQVPATALQNNQLQKVLTGPIIQATMGLPPHLATTLLQQHVNTMFGQTTATAAPPPPPTVATQQQQGVTLTTAATVNKALTQTDGALDEEDEGESSAIMLHDLMQLLRRRKCAEQPSTSTTIRRRRKSSQSSPGVAAATKLKLPLLDGAMDDTSDDDDDVSVDDDDDDVSDDQDDDKDDDEHEMMMMDADGVGGGGAGGLGGLGGAGGPEEEPLNSEDDVTDDDPTDLFDTENVVVCQYDKITRSRNKWKFHLKDGIMNLNGEDYVFQKANGDAEW